MIVGAGRRPGYRAAVVSDRERCVDLLERGDWYGLYRAAMSWRVAGGGSWTAEAWLMDVCSALLHGQPRTAVRCCDMALTTWVERPGDRLVLRYVRGLLVARHLGDPARAVDDLDAATAGPSWLAALAVEEVAHAREAAARSRVRVPRAEPSPRFTGAHRSAVAPPEHPLPDDGAMPPTWALVLPRLRPEGEAAAGAGTGGAQRTRSAPPAAT